MKLSRLKGYIEASHSPRLVQAEIAALLYPRSFRIGTSIFNSILYGIVLTYLMRNWLPTIWTVVALLLCANRSYDWWLYRKKPALHQGRVDRALHHAARAPVSACRLAAS